MTSPPHPGEATRTAALNLAGFTTLGGFCAMMVEQSLWIGAAVYYALLLVALGSPQAAPFRRAVMSRAPRRPSRWAAARPLLLDGPEPV